MKQADATTKTGVIKKAQMEKISDVMVTFVAEKRKYLRKQETLVTTCQDMSAL